MKLQIRKSTMLIFALLILLVTSVIGNIVLYINITETRETHKSEIQTLEKEIQQLEMNQPNAIDSFLQDEYKEQQEAIIKTQYLDCLSGMMEDNPNGFNVEEVEMFRTLCRDITGFKN